MQLKAVEEERELEVLAEAVIESNKKAMQFLKEAHKAAQNTLAHLSSSKRTIITSQQECLL